jgi:HK97 gp10 family phage protein
MPGRVATPEVLRQAAEVASRELDDRGRRVVARATQLVPVRTGALRSSIGHSVRMTADGPILVISATAPYAGFVELGTARRPAHPFIRPALAEVFGHDLAAAAPLIQLGAVAPAAH